TCTCGENGSATCTTIACPGDGGSGCTYNGAHYDPGARVPGGCGACTCQADGTVGCDLGCPADGGSQCCDYGGVHRDVGASFPSTDGCNTCSCDASGDVFCTQRACLPDGGSSSCSLDATYTVGSVGGLVAYADVTTLTPPTGFTF